MHAGEFYNIFNTKINTVHVKVFAWKLVSSRPVNADCSFNETSQIENKCDNDIIRDKMSVSSTYFNFEIHLGAPLVLAPRANALPTPRYATARAHGVRVGGHPVVKDIK
jgi:hypothetical protein